MIGKLKGSVDEIHLDHIILDVSGVGYKVFLSSPTISDLATGSALSLNIEMYVREDQMLLYGFTTKLEQKWFNLLQTVQGVGSRVALVMLSTFSPETLYHAIITDDQRTIKSITGIGPKLASRIVNELKTHQELSSSLMQFNSDKTAMNISSAFSANSVYSDALNALSSLGFARADIAKVLSEINNSNKDLPLEDLIRLTLAKMAPQQ